MGAMAERWPASPDGDRRRARLLTALGVSLLCHTLVLLGARGWQVESRPSPWLVVTMVERGGGGDEGSAGAAPPLAPAVAASAAMTKAVPLPAERRQVPLRRVHATAPATVARPPTATVLASAASTADGSLAAASGAPTTVGDGSGALGAGSGGGTPGSGRGSGGGSDGLRTFCRDCPAPEYPSRARRQGWQGTVDVELAIGHDGAVQEARLRRSSGYPALDEVALGVARQSRFALSAGGDGLRGQLRYRFVLDETAARSSNP